MKKVSMLLVAICNIISVNLHAQIQPTLNSLLPKSVLDRSGEIKEGVSTLLNKTNILNPGFKNTASLKSDIDKAFTQYKARKPALSKFTLPDINANSFDKLIADKEKELGANSSFVSVLKSLKVALENAGDNDAVVTVMCNTIKSPKFSTLSASQKDILYYTFAATKAVLDYAVANKMLAATGPAENFEVGMVGSGPRLEYFGNRGNGKFCHWAITVVGGAIGAVFGGVPAAAGAAAGFIVGANLCYSSK